MSFLDDFKNLIGKKKKEEDDGVLRIVDIIAPSSIDEKQGHLKLGERYTRSFFIFSYPRYLNAGWLSSIINLNIQIDISFFITPLSTADVLKKLRKQITATQAEIIDKQETGNVRDPILETAHGDMEELRDRLQMAEEKMFQLGLYITVFGDSEKETEDIENTLRSILESSSVYIRPTLFQQSGGFISTSPFGLDFVNTETPMNTNPLSSIFPFISSDLTSNDGILYGKNVNNRSLVIFDRFSLENPNSVIFGVSGGGKSYLVKLEALRSLMLGIDVIIIDPENEYKTLAEAAGGSFFNISLSSSNHINPFDISIPAEGETVEGAIRRNTISLVGLLRIMLGGLSPEEDSIIDQAITETYAAKNITPESDPSTWEKNVPIFSDLGQILDSMEGTKNLVLRLGKFTQGTYSDFFNQYTNVSMNNNITVFGIRDLENEMRPIAMFIIARYIWKTITSSVKKRVFIVDEAWIMMKHEDGASFLFGLVKRARKYWLGVTTITQDVSDFMSSSYGKPIVTNSALKILLKQSSAVIDTIQKTFNLTGEEKSTLLEGEVGEGIFFAGQKHVVIKITASYTEDQIITSSPEELQKIKQAKASL
ncbi:MAG: ATP-binding protein [Patescibacteria group bacterium]|nr:ATP-binding protein [Patescibacteria group bacterium]